MEIYNYHAETKEYTGQGFADPSPLEPGKWLIPANATTVMPPSPLPGKVRCFDGTAWAYADLPDEPKDPEYMTSLNSLAEAKLSRINEAKNVALDGGFWHAGVFYDSDSKARLAYLELATQIQMDPTFSTPWKASTGSWVTMDATLFAALIPTYRTHVQGCFAWQAAREADVAAALALVTPVLDAEGVETGEVDEGAARAALEAVIEVFPQ